VVPQVGELLLLTGGLCRQGRGRGGCPDEAGRRARSCPRSTRTRSAEQARRVRRGARPAGRRASSCAASGPKPQRSPVGRITPSLNTAATHGDYERILSGEYPRRDTDRKRVGGRGKRRNAAKSTGTSGDARKTPRVGIFRGVAETGRPGASGCRPPQPANAAAVRAHGYGGGSAAGLAAALRRPALATPRGKQRTNSTFQVPPWLPRLLPGMNVTFIRQELRREAR